MKKNVLLASAVLMTLGMATSVNADEKTVAEPVVVVSEKAENTAKTETVAKEDAPAAKEVETEEDVDLTDEEVEALDKEIAEQEKQMETLSQEDDEDTDADEEDDFSHEYKSKINQWTGELTNFVAAAENLTVDKNVDLEAFLKTYYFDMMDRLREVQVYTDKNGISDEAQALMDALDAYLEEVAPVMDQLIALGEKFYGGELTKEQLQAEVERLVTGSEQVTEKPEVKTVVPEKKQETTPAPVENKTEVAPVQVEAKPVATQAAATTVETLPETASDAKSFISVIGAALAGLTVWGFGFKKRG